MPLPIMPGSRAPLMGVIWKNKSTDLHRLTLPASPPDLALCRAALGTRHLGPLTKHLPSPTPCGACCSCPDNCAPGWHLLCPVLVQQWEEGRCRRWAMPCRQCLPLGTLYPNPFT